MNLQRNAKRMEIKSQIKTLGIIGKKVISHIPELTKVIIFIFIVEIVYYYAVVCLYILLCRLYITFKLTKYIN